VLSSGRPIRSLVRELPESERAILVLQNTKSILVIPIMIEGQFWGFIGFDVAILNVSGKVLKDLFFMSRQLLEVQP
jgi:hypothetical protein